MRADLLADIVAESVGPDAMLVDSGCRRRLSRMRASWAAERPRRAVVVTGSITLVADALARAEEGGWK